MPVPPVTEPTAWNVLLSRYSDAATPAPVTVTAKDHGGGGKTRIDMWDGAKWVPVSGWIEGNKALIHPLFLADAKKFAKEKGITPRDCASRAMRGWWPWSRWTARCALPTSGPIPPSMHAAKRAQMPWPKAFGHPKAALPT